MNPYLYEHPTPSNIGKLRTEMRRIIKLKK